MSHEASELEHVEVEIRFLEHKIISAVNQTGLPKEGNRTYKTYKELRSEHKRFDTAVSIYNRLFPNGFSQQPQYTYVEKALANLIIINDKRVKILDECQRRDDVEIDSLERIFKMNQMLHFRQGILVKMYNHHTKSNFFASILKPDNTNAINRNTRDVLCISSA